MIRLTDQHWWELSEAMLDDSAGPLDELPFTVQVIDDSTVELHFDSPQQETFFRLRWME